MARSLGSGRGGGQLGLWVGLLTVTLWALGQRGPSFVQQSLCCSRPARGGASARSGTQAARPSPVALRALQLYGSQGSRSPLVNWYLEELGQEYQMIDVATVDRTAPAFPHPFGQIPALADGDVKVFESGAILIYLAQKYGGLSSPEALAEVAKWIVWANASLDPVVFIENDRGQVLDTGLRQNPKVIQRLESLLEGQSWLLGEEFSVADVAVASYLLYGIMFFPDVQISKWPNIARYMAAAAKRPAYAKAFGPRTAEALVAQCEKPPADDKMFGLF